MTKLFIEVIVLVCISHELKCASPPGVSFSMAFPEPMILQPREPQGATGQQQPPTSTTSSFSQQSFPPNFQQNPPQFQQSSQFQPPQNTQPFTNTPNIQSFQQPPANMQMFPQQPPTNMQPFQPQPTTNMQPFQQQQPSNMMQQPFTSPNSNQPFQNLAQQQFPPQQWQNQQQSPPFSTQQNPSFSDQFPLTGQMPQPIQGQAMEFLNRPNANQGQPLNTNSQFPGQQQQLNNLPPGMQNTVNPQNSQMQPGTQQSSTGMPSSQTSPSPTGVTGQQLPVDNLQLSNPETQIAANYIMKQLTSLLSDPTTRDAFVLMMSDFRNILANPQAYQVMQAYNGQIQDRLNNPQAYNLNIPATVTNTATSPPIMPGTTGNMFPNKHQLPTLPSTQGDLASIITGTTSSLADLIKYKGRILTDLLRGEIQTKSRFADQLTADIPGVNAVTKLSTGMLDQAFGTLDRTLGPLLNKGTGGTTMTTNAANPNQSTLAQSTASTTPNSTGNYQPNANTTPANTGNYPVGTTASTTTGNNNNYPGYNDFNRQNTG